MRIKVFDPDLKRNDSLEFALSGLCSECFDFFVENSTEIELIWRNFGENCVCPKIELTLTATDSMGSEKSVKVDVERPDVESPIFTESEFRAKLREFSAVFEPFLIVRVCDHTFWLVAAPSLPARSDESKPSYI